MNNQLLPHTRLPFLRRSALTAAVLGFVGSACLIPTATAQVLFDADFEGSTPGGGLTVANLNAGTSTGTWGNLVDSGDPNDDIFENTTESNNLLVLDVGYEAEAFASSAGNLTDGVDVEWSFTFRRETVGRDHRWQIKDADGDVGVTLEARDNGPGTDRFQLVLVETGGDTFLFGDVANVGVFNPPEADLTDFRIELSETSFDVLANGTIVGSDLSYGADFDNVNSIFFEGLIAQSGGIYDNISITQVPEPAAASLILAGITGLVVFLRRRRRQ